MPIYHLTLKHVSRGTGGKVVASAAYRSGQKLRDERNQETHDYTRKGGVHFTEIMAPDSAPDWVGDRERLWNEVEKAEKRKDAQLAMECEVALPRELSREDQIKLLRGFADEQFVKRGMIADISIHESRSSDGSTNPHAHILLTTRHVTENGFGQKARQWREKDNLLLYREAWAERSNAALDEAGSSARIDHRSLKDQGVMREPGQHLGREATALARRGDESRRIDGQPSSMDRELAPMRQDIEENGMISMPAISQAQGWWERAADMAVYVKTRVREGWQSVRERFRQLTQTPDQPSQTPSR